MKMVADKIIAFNQQLKYHGELPKGFRVVNPFVETQSQVDFGNILPELLERPEPEGVHHRD
jgi:hypothetical protein